MDSVGFTISRRSSSPPPAPPSPESAASPRGALADVLPALKKRFDRNRGEIVLVFDDATGRQVDFDLTGSVEQVPERAIPSAPRGPGRPRLGVTSREVSLLPRHWEWLEHQSSGRCVGSWIGGSPTSRAANGHAGYGPR